MRDPRAAPGLADGELGHHVMAEFDALEDRMTATERQLLGERHADRRARLDRLNLNIRLSVATKEGAVTIRIETAPRAPTTPVAIEVRDTGIGIAPNRLAAIFEAFEQGDVGVGREYGGTGLGLSISRALCRLLHYDLSVSSVLGAGSVFRVTLAREGAVRPTSDVS